MIDLLVLVKWSSSYFTSILVFSQLSLCLLCVICRNTLISIDVSTLFSILFLIIGRMPILSSVDIFLLHHVTFFKTSKVLLLLIT